LLGLYLDRDLDNSCDRQVLELMNSKMLYPPPEDSQAESSISQPQIRSNSYEPFRLLDTRIEQGLRGMAEEEQRRMEESEGEGINGKYRSCL
jgi:hypothetical protein